MTDTIKNLKDFYDSKAAASHYCDLSETGAVPGYQGSMAKLTTETVTELNNYDLKLAEVAATMVDTDRDTAIMVRDLIAGVQDFFSDDGCYQFIVCYLLSDDHDYDVDNIDYTLTKFRQLLTSDLLNDK